MRQNGLTAFEAELVNYILTNEISEGTTFRGVPEHPRYGASKEEELVVVFNSETLSVKRVGKKVITINFADYAAGRKKTPTTKATTNNNTNNNNTNNMEEQNTTTTNMKKELKVIHDALKALEFDVVYNNDNDVLETLFTTCGRMEYMSTMTTKINILSLES